MRFQEEEQDSGVVEDFLEFNWEHIRIYRGSKGRTPGLGAPRFQGLRWDFSFFI